MQVFYCCRKLGSILASVFLFFSFCQFTCYLLLFVAVVWCVLMFCFNCVRFGSLYRDVLFECRMNFKSIHLLFWLLVVTLASWLLLTTSRNGSKSKYSALTSICTAAHKDCIVTQLTRTVLAHSFHQSYLTFLGQVN